MKVIVSGGGTGGHIYPALALIKEIKKREPNAEFLYIGTEKGLESTLVKREDIPFKTIDITGFKRKFSLENVKTIIRFFKGVSRSKKLIREFEPDIVIGTGGYVCGPVVYAASKLNVATIVHEQNSVPGLTNKFLSKYVNKVAISFKEAESFFPKEKVVHTGNPRATEASLVEGRDRLTDLGLNKDKKTVLIVGGSRGARPINDAFLEVLEVAGKRDYQFLYVTGEVHYDTVMAKVQEHGNPPNIKIAPFIHNMPEVLKNVHLIVARAGATTLAEVTAIGLPSILIPSPYVTNNHQEKNARALSDNGAAVIKLEKELSGPILLKEIDAILLNEKKWEQMHKDTLKLGMPESGKLLYELIKQLIK
ncbi:undecaprenyldiphospho-muramoylpentapeptide beta-N-acetylglucosaminyltransferase [Anaerobacillus isosaccharinicus]|uniref:UDP-N-acetylglucosamine--N-acetylmuramyl-(pentapeptide) pyrophosphoryl-undecaprenol N-acetylglucosamine transferase n=1 Tax=Anaerobacillus isosaccharinicus TaxID=1532552 RepID=A0A1S2MA84_9BACI|nr:undecaprenyldiphospho-muramoylpentapeptide beta-N-acetylglucosaminyltransferase [Anaerobacillus isosaccharinicus]MBA5587437.1 undecaprenyldiphospho-muramoylpentapeptide beta-N-acetylglucosaminyltransferase [Anaerobacillus isosaccharinicus]QOY34376.1 undecaprenyldiphospho-muramoylpentapeptide beta-N-acetylglucosaminyltransferase [Anaerobacillus isosaccharinicus]